VRVVIEGYSNPGYLETSKMIGECAILIATQKEKLPGKNGGVLTPAAGYFKFDDSINGSRIGVVLAERLKNSGMRVEIKPL
jgi:hypothetical protein